MFSISRFILDDIIYDIVRIFSHNHKECCRLLRDLPSFLNQNYLDDGQYNIYAAIAETLFSEIVRLPRSQEPSIYYATLLGDLTKEDLSTFPKVLGRAVRILYSRLDDDQHVSGGMDVECIRRLSEWFAVHLSNFTYQWKWQDWSVAFVCLVDQETEADNGDSREPVLQSDPSSGKFVFVRETLEKCCRLSYYERIKTTVPPEFLGKALPASAPVYHFKYENAKLTGGCKTLPCSSRFLLLTRGNLRSEAPRADHPIAEGLRS